MRNCIFEIGAAALMIVVSAGDGLAQTPPAKSLRPAAIVIRPPSKPVPIFTGDDSDHAIYEIALTNYDRRALKIDELDLAAKALEACTRVSLSYRGKDLWAIRDKSRNQSYHCYGRPILAIADGTIVEVREGIVENSPGPGWDPPIPPAIPIDLETVARNHIVEDLGGSRYALHAHLIPGSLKLKPGDKVAHGAPIGKGKQLRQFDRTSSAFSGDGRPVAARLQRSSLRNRQVHPLLLQLQIRGEGPSLRDDDRFAQAGSR